MERADDVGDELFEMGDFLPPINLGSPEPEVTSLACGGTCECALLSNSTVRCWGQKGANGGTGQYEFEASSGNALGTMGVMLPPTQLPSGRLATSISCGSEHCCVVLEDDDAFCWGKNDQGQVGNGRDVLDVCKVWNDGTCGANLVPVNLGYGRYVLDIALGDDWSCAVLDNEVVHCWGKNDDNYLGVDSDKFGTKIGDSLLEPGGLVEPNTFQGGKAVKFFAIALSRCVILHIADVVCWGNSTDSQLGISTEGTLFDLWERTVYPTVDLGGRKAFALAVGSGYDNAHQCTMLSAADCDECEDEIKCWGDNGSGQLGYGDTRNRGTTRGDFVNDVVDLGSPGVHPAFELGGYDRAPEPTPPAAISALSLGNQHTCAILTMGRVPCWGHKNKGQLNGFDTTPIGGGISEAVYKLKLKHFGYDASKRPEMERFFAKKIFGLIERSCAILEDDSLSCWGISDKGVDGHDQANVTTARVPLLDSMDAPARVVDVCGGEHHLCMATSEGAMWCWGEDSDSYGFLGLRTNTGVETVPTKIDLGTDEQARR